MPRSFQVFERPLYSLTVVEIVNDDDKYLVFKPEDDISSRGGQVVSGATLAILQEAFISIHHDRDIVALRNEHGNIVVEESRLNAKYPITRQGYRMRSKRV